MHSTNGSHPLQVGLKSSILDILCLVVGKLQYIGNPTSPNHNYRVTPRFGTRRLRKIEVTGDSNCG
jgi:hypothetical protein